MNPFFCMTPFDLRFNQTSKFTLYRPSTSISFSVSYFKNDLDTLLIECMNINPNALIEKLIHDP